jgi:hypothetical protein
MQGKEKKRKEKKRKEKRRRHAHSAASSLIFVYSRHYFLRTLLSFIGI